MYARPWKRVNDFYLNLIHGTMSLPLLFGAERLGTETPALYDKSELESVSNESCGRWARITFKITLSYHGVSFEGWQKQPGLKTVQRQDVLIPTCGVFLDPDLRWQRSFLMSHSQLHAIVLY